jgi:hypothetical protein
LGAVQRDKSLSKGVKIYKNQLVCSPVGGTFNIDVVDLHSLIQEVG